MCLVGVMVRVFFLTYRRPPGSTRTYALFPYPTICRSAVGAVAVVPMLALALTSTRGWMSRLGSYWQTLHRSVYAIALLSVWHFWLVRAGKNDFNEIGRAHV